MVKHTLKILQQMLHDFLKFAKSIQCYHCFLILVPIRLQSAPLLRGVDPTVQLLT